MPWTCPNCGFHLKGAVVLPVHCVCSFVDGLPASSSIEEFRALWLKLHRYAFTVVQWSALTAARWLAVWEEHIPGGTCQCRSHWKDFNAKLPPDFSSREAFFAWTVRAHNWVNARLRKPQLGIEMALEANGLLPDVVHAQQSPITAFVAVTSVSPQAKHLVNQPRCFDSWKRFGLRIVAVNRSDEIRELAPLYPQIDQWVACDEISDVYSFHTQRINSLLDQAKRLDSPILLINSDIEIYGAQERLLSILSQGRVGVGIRYNYEGHWRSGLREGWGIDAFLMTPEQAATVPQLEFCIGRPMWDYWLPYHFDSVGQPMEWIGEPYLYHESHAVHWSQSDLELGRKWIAERYGRQENWENVRRQWPFHV